MYIKIASDDISSNTTSGAVVLMATAYGYYKKRKGDGRVVRLTPKQEKFAKAIAYEGMNNTDAYKSAYSVKNMSDNAVYVEACNLAQNPKVALRVKELAKELDSPRIMSATQRREKLTELAESEDPNIVLRSIDLLNKMDGEYIQKVVAEVSSYENSLKKVVDEDEY